MSIYRIAIVIFLSFFLCSTLLGQDEPYDKRAVLEAYLGYPLETEEEKPENLPPNKTRPFDHRAVLEEYLGHPLKAEEPPPPPPPKKPFNRRALLEDYLGHPLPEEVPPPEPSPTSQKREYDREAVLARYLNPPQPPPEPTVYLPPPPSSSSHLSVLIPAISYTAGPGRSYQRGYETVEVFTGRYTPDEHRCFFADVRFHHVQSDEFAENIGFGWRHFSADFQHMFGANVFYDLRRFSDDSVQQVGVGFELFAPCWDLRGNGYFPVGKDTIVTDKTRFNFPTGLFTERTGKIAAMWGFDVTLGTHLCTTCCFDLYAALGTYAYDSKCCNHVIGALGRLTLEVCKWSEIELLVTHDELFSTKVQGIFTLRFPFSCFCECWECLFEPVRRNDIIITERICTWTSNF